MHLRIENPERGTLLGVRIRVADTFFSRLRGLLGTPPLAEGEGLLLHPCRAVHMWGMCYCLDIICLSSDATVLALFPSLGPGQQARGPRGGQMMLELPSGTVERTRTQIGDRLLLHRLQA